MVVMPLDFVAADVKEAVWVEAGDVLVEEEVTTTAEPAASVLVRVKTTTVVEAAWVMVVSVGVMVLPAALVDFDVGAVVLAAVVSGALLSLLVLVASVVCCGWEDVDSGFVVCGSVVFAAADEDDVAVVVALDVDVGVAVDEAEVVVGVLDCGVVDEAAAEGVS